MAKSEIETKNFPSTEPPVIVDSECVLPTWLDSGLVEEKLQKYFKDNALKVLSLRAEPAIGKNENFISFISRLTVELNKAPGKHTKPELSIIAKIAQTGGAEYAFLSEAGVLYRETKFFDSIAPKMEKYLKKLSDSSVMVPECYGVCKENNTIFLEDMKTEGYGNDVKVILGGFSVEEAKLVLKKVAALHATGIMLQNNQPDIFNGFQDGMINKGPGFEKFLIERFDVILKQISKWPEFAYYTEKLTRFREHLMRHIRNSFFAHSNHLNTLVHGDMWSNNIMIKRTDGDQSNIEKLIIIDFQFACWNSPAVDLQYFIATSLQDHLRPDCCDELIAFYYEYLAKYLKELNFSKRIPTLKEFKSQYADKNLWGFIGTCLIKPLILNENPADFETLFLGNEKTLEVAEKTYAQPNVQAILRKYIPYFEELGIFN